MNIDGSEQVRLTNNPASDGRPSFSPAPETTAAVTNIPETTASEATTLPTYSEIVSTYPKGVELSCTNAEVSDVTPDGEWVFTGGLICAGKSQLTVEAGGTFTIGEGELFFGKPWKSYGAKITVMKTVTIDGKTKFSCIDGPEFEAQAVDWDELTKRNRIYEAKEKHICNFHKFS